jgi:hypothetical protein
MHDKKFRRVGIPCLYHIKHGDDVDVNVTNPLVLTAAIHHHTTTTHINSNGTPIRKMSEKPENLDEHKEPIDAPYQALLRAINANDVEAIERELKLVSLAVDERFLELIYIAVQKDERIFRSVVLAYARQRRDKDLKDCLKLVAQHNLFLAVEKLIKLFSIDVAKLSHYVLESKCLVFLFVYFSCLSNLLMQRQ